MSFSRKIMFLLAGLLFPVQAWAQPLPSANNIPTRVQVQINVQGAAIASDKPEEQAKAMQKARLTIYESAKSECAVLTSVFGADCRLMTVNAGSSIYSRGAMGPVVNANGSASFQLTPRRPQAPAGK